MKSSDEFLKEFFDNANTYGPDWHALMVFPNLRSAMGFVSEVRDEMPLLAFETSRRTFKTMKNSRLTVIFAHNEEDIDRYRGINYQQVGVHDRVFERAYPMLASLVRSPVLDPKLLNIGHFSW